MKRRSIHVICILSMFIGVMVYGADPAHAAPPKVGTHAEGAALIDVESGRLLYSHNGTKRMRIASLTKIMTAIVAIESGDLADQVTVSRNAFGKEGSSIYLRLGEKMTLEHLLYGLMLRSGNDAAVAIAEHIGGSLEGFAYLMNEKARWIGMERSHFTNPHGLDDSNDHYSTADDMAKLTAYALKNPVFQQIVKTKIKKVPNSYENWDHVWRNKNKMLSFYEGADGVKTGYTKLGNRCLVSSATRNGQQVAVVTLNDPDDWADHTLLLNYGFKHFEAKTIVEKASRVNAGDQVLAAGRTLTYPLTQEEVQLIRKETVLEQPKSLAHRLGERGKQHIYLDRELIGIVPLYEVGNPILTASKPIMGVANRSFFTSVSSMIRSLFTLH